VSNAAQRRFSRASTGRLVSHLCMAAVGRPPCVGDPTTKRSVAGRRSGSTSLIGRTVAPPGIAEAMSLAICSVLPKLVS
jgi:hypothetical protein